MLQGIVYGENATPPIMNELCCCERRFFPGWDFDGTDITEPTTINPNELIDDFDFSNPEDRYKDRNRGEDGNAISHVRRHRVEHIPTIEHNNEAFTFARISGGELVQFIEHTFDAEPVETEELSTNGRRIFPGWERDGVDIFEITEPTVINLNELDDYSIRRHRVAFLLNSNGLEGTRLGGGSLIQNVEHSKNAVLPDVGDPYGHSFISWGDGKEHRSIGGPRTITAVYAPDPYYVIFFNYDGTDFDRQRVYFGDSGSFPEGSPRRYGHAFREWDSDHLAISSESDIEISPVFSISRHTVIFENWNGDVLSTQTVSHGSSAEAPDEPEREGYGFTGWDREFDYIDSDLTVTAMFSAACGEQGCDGTESLCPDCGRCGEHCACQTADGGNNAKCDRCSLFDERCACCEYPDCGNRQECEHCDKCEEHCECILPLTAGGDGTTRTIIAGGSPLGNPPLFSFMGRNIHLFAPLHIASWAIANLLLTMLGAVLVAIKLLQKYKKNNECEESKSAIEERGRGRKKWLLPASVFGAIAVLLFAITQDMAALTALFDTWTIAHMAIFIIQIICTKAYSKSLEQDEAQPMPEPKEAAQI